ncbi:MAG: ParA family protein [Chloroflexota bacterium]|nr:ParA family protein [Chloroflexota bacterium]
MSQIIAIANDKGGVAKTTTAVSLGGAMVAMKGEVMLIDLDPQASLTLALGVPPHTVRNSIADVLLNSASLLSTSRETYVPGLDLVPSNSELLLTERFLPTRNNYKNILREAIDDTHYDTLILDCPPSLGAITQNALIAADILIIPTTPDYLSTYALRSIMGLIGVIRDNDNPQLDYRILVTMLDQRIKSHTTFDKQLRATFDNTVFATAIQVDTRLRDSAIAGLPITHYLSHTRSAQQYRALAQELAQYVKSK